MKKLLSITLAGLMLVTIQSAAAVLITDDFTYIDGPLAGSGDWARGVNSPAADNPSDYISVENNQVKFDWTTTDPINNVVRHLWDSADQLTTGSAYAIFDFRVTLAPSVEANARPGFFSFANSAGSAQRGFVGIQAGSSADTFQLGVSANSQLDTNFAFSNMDLVLNTSYTIMVGHDIDASTTSLWIGTTNPALTPIVSSTSGTTADLRRVNLRMYNSDGDVGTTNLGTFYLDNLTITTIPEPSTYAVLAGLMAMAMIIRRRFKK